MTVALTVYPYQRALLDALAEPGVTLVVRRMLDTTVILAGGTDGFWTVFPQNAKVLKAGTYVTAMLYLSTANTAVGDNSYLIAGGLAVA